MSEVVDRCKLQPALWKAAECACTYHLTDGFCSPRNVQQCKCWDRAEATMVATGLSARAVGFIFQNLRRIEDAAEKAETATWHGTPWWSKPERVAVENKQAASAEGRDRRGREAASADRVATPESSK